MDSITLENFRCFRKRQTARLAPLTLLVGENSTGKTSFLAMVRALHDFASTWRIPDFKKEPYDLGSFDEIAHFRGGRGGRASTFMGGFSRSSESARAELAVTFQKRGPSPRPAVLRIKAEDTWFERSYLEATDWTVRCGTKRGAWQTKLDLRGSHAVDEVLLPWWILFQGIPSVPWTSLNGSAPPSAEDLRTLAQVVRTATPDLPQGPSVVASAPVRSRPRRTYDPELPVRDSEGAWIPLLLADLSDRDPAAWTRLKQLLESFGRRAGLFDEIVPHPLGKQGVEPFQLRVRKFGRRAKGPFRNLMDVGYGVSQILPLVTELLRSRGKSIHLLQQPEVHLHPSAQAALGSFLCQIASSRRQVIVETHSDYLLNRVRMDVRDSEDGVLKPRDIAILFFERRNLGVRIHSLRIDAEGNVVGAPIGYRRFFMEEVSRSLWKQRAD